VNRSVNPVAQIRKIIKRGGVTYTKRELELLDAAPVKSKKDKRIFTVVKKPLDIPVKGQ
jgi:hypothetical protein